jgi:hypothetical protein
MCRPAYPVYIMVEGKLRVMYKLEIIYVFKNSLFSCDLSQYVPVVQCQTE